MNLSIDFESALKFVSLKEQSSLDSKGIDALNKILNKSDEGSDYLGWHDYSLNYDKDEFERIKKASLKIRSNSKVLVVIGIGGSYLGAKAVIDALKPYFTKDSLEIIFAGNTISSEYLASLIDYLKDKDFSVNVISKSGTTTEPALTFRFIKELLESKYNKNELKDRIYLTTDSNKGALRQIGLENGCPMFKVPDDIGGRYSVISAVGLLPICAAGYNIDSFMEGFNQSRIDNLNKDSNSYKYAIMRNCLYNKDYFIEILESYEPKLTFINEWWKQLFGESEGKNNKGIYPASCIFSTDLHSMGQYIQEGRRNLFETVIEVKDVNKDLTVKEDKDNLDNLNYLTNKTVDFVNKTALEATRLAHTDGNVPVIKITIDKVDEYNLGYLMYFFMKACAISGYILGINPFNQPGVEAYKTNMFKMLGKPGYKD